MTLWDNISHALVHDGVIDYDFIRDLVAGFIASILIITGTTIITYLFTAVRGIGQNAYARLQLGNTLLDLHREIFGIINPPNRYVSLVEVRPQLQEKVIEARLKLEQ